MMVLSEAGERSIVVMVKERSRIRGTYLGFRSQSNHIRNVSRYGITCRLTLYQLPLR
jgi:hypothetical protein